MIAHPIRRIAGAVGLVGLVPTAVMVMIGSVSVSEAAVRAVITLLGTLAVARGISWALVSLVGGEVDQEEAGPDRAPHAAGGGDRAGAREREPQRGNAISAASTTTGSNRESEPARRRSTHSDDEGGRPVSEGVVRRAS